MEDSELLFAKVLELARKIVDEEESNELEVEIQKMNKLKDQLVDHIYEFVKTNVKTKNVELIKKANELLENIVKVASKNMVITKELLK